MWLEFDRWLDTLFCSGAFHLNKKAGRYQLNIKYYQDYISNHEHHI